MANPARGRVRKAFFLASAFPEAVPFDAVDLLENRRVVGHGSFGNFVRLGSLMVRPVVLSVRWDRTRRTRGRRGHDRILGPVVNRTSFRTGGMVSAVMNATNRFLCRWYWIERVDDAVLVWVRSRCRRRRTTRTGVSAMDLLITLCNEKHSTGLVPMFSIPILLLRRPPYRIRRSPRFVLFSFRLGNCSVPFLQQTLNWTFMFFVRQWFSPSRISSGAAMK